LASITASSGPALSSGGGEQFDIDAPAAALLRSLSQIASAIRHVTHAT
jgi:hypothetical protein